MTRAGFTFTSSRAELRIGRILTALAQPMTTNQLRLAVPMARATAIIFLAHLRAERRVYVSGWLAGGGRHAPIYALGNKPDVPEPPRITRKTKYQRERTRLQADPFKMAGFRARRNTREHPRQAARDPLLSWIPTKAQ